MPNDPTKIRVGPGKLKVAPVGTAEPVDLATAWNVAWVDVGYTEEGHSFTASRSFEPVEVAEEIDPISYQPTGREMSVSFAMAEMTALNMSRALNGGTIAVAGAVTTFDPPDLGAETRIAIAWEALDGKERWIWRKCLNTGDLEIARRKAPDKATIPVEFMCEILAGTSIKPFRAIFSTT